MPDKIPPLPDEVIEEVRQLSDSADTFQWRIGDILCDVWDEVGREYTIILDSERRAHAYIIGQVANRAGIAKSTLRDRENMSKFFPKPVRKELEPLTYHQARALKSAGDQWQEYKKWVFDFADQEGYFPSVEAIRDKIKAAGADLPLWQKRMNQIIPLLVKVSLDPEAPTALTKDAAEFLMLLELKHNQAGK